MLNNPDALRSLISTRIRQFFLPLHMLHTLSARASKFLHHSSLLAPLAFPLLEFFSYLDAVSSGVKSNYSIHPFCSSELNYHEIWSTCGASKKKCVGTRPYWQDRSHSRQDREGGDGGQKPCITNRTTPCGDYLSVLGYWQTFALDQRQWDRSQLEGAHDRASPWDWCVEDNKPVRW